MTAAAAARHHGDGADLRPGDARAVMGERARHVGAGAAIAVVLQHHVHEARAPEAAAAGRIAAEIAARIGDEAGARQGGVLERHAARVGNDAGIAVGNAGRLYLRDAALPTLLLCDMAIGTPRLIADYARRAVHAGSHEGVAWRRHLCRVARPLRLLRDPPGILMPGMILSVVPSRLVAGIGLRVVRGAMIRAGRS